MVQKAKVAKAMLDRLEKKLDKAHKQQIQDGLAEVFTKLSCRAVAREIKAGRKVSGNAAFGFRMCVHEKLGPTVNIKTGKFYPQTQRNKNLEKKFEVFTNKLLKSGGFRLMPKNLIPALRKKDKAFEKRVKARKW